MNLQNMAPNAKRSLFISAGAAVAACAVYFMMVEPAQETIKKLSQRQEESTSRHQQMSIALTNGKTQDARLAECTEKLRQYQSKLLEPLLESTAMRAKSFLDKMAIEAGLSDAEYNALPERKLPVPQKLPSQLYARCPISISFNGSYQAAVSFLLRVEKEFPFVALGALTIRGGQSPEKQHITMVLEWPIKGAVTTPDQKGAVKK